MCISTDTRSESSVYTVSPHRWRALTCGNQAAGVSSCVGHALAVLQAVLQAVRDENVAQCDVGIHGGRWHQAMLNWGPTGAYWGLTCLLLLDMYSAGMITCSINHRVKYCRGMTAC